MSGQKRSEKQVLPFEPMFPSLYPASLVQSPSELMLRLGILDCCVEAQQPTKINSDEFKKPAHANLPYRRVLTYSSDKSRACTRRLAGLSAWRALPACLGCRRRRRRRRPHSFQTWKRERALLYLAVTGLLCAQP